MFMDDVMFMKYWDMTTGIRQGNDKQHQERMYQLCLGALYGYIRYMGCILRCVLPSNHPLGWGYHRCKTIPLDDWTPQDHKGRYTEIYTPQN